MIIEYFIKKIKNKRPKASKITIIKKKKKEERYHWHNLKKKKFTTFFAAPHRSNESHQ